MRRGLLAFLFILPIFSLYKTVPLALHITCCHSEQPVPFLRRESEESLDFFRATLFINKGRNSYGCGSVITVLKSKYFLKKSKTPFSLLIMDVEKHRINIKRSGKNNLSESWSEGLISAGSLLLTKMDKRFDLIIINKKSKYEKSDLSNNYSGPLITGCVQFKFEI